MENINLSLDTLVSSDCNQLGVITGWDDWEYPIWALAQHRNIDLRIEHVLVKDPSKKYSQPFVPCAILVTGQKEEHTIKFNDVDFSKVMDEKAFSLYLNENIVDR